MIDVVERPYGAGALMTVFTIVTEASKASSLPLIVVTAATPAVETDIPNSRDDGSHYRPPPITPLIVAELPTCQKTFLAWAPLIRRILSGADGVPTVR